MSYTGTTPFKNTKGNWLTKGLFKETAAVDKTKVQFTFDEQPVQYTEPDTGKVKILDSFVQLYVSYCMKDPTEVLLAETVLGGYDHWQAILQNQMLRSRIQKLRDRVATSLKAQAYTYLINEVNTEGKNAYQSARYLLDKGVVPELKKPTKAKQKNDELNKQASSVVSDDAKRLGLKLVSGDKA